MSLHNLPFTVIGAGLLWVGWFGFNAGSALAADGIAASAFVATQVAAAAGALAWLGVEWGYRGKPTNAENFIRSAIAPLIKATVMPANIN